MAPQIKNNHRRRSVCKYCCEKKSEKSKKWRAQPTKANSNATELLITNEPITLTFFGRAKEEEDGVDGGGFDADDGDFRDNGTFSRSWIDARSDLDKRRLNARQLEMSFVGQIENVVKGVEARVSSPQAHLNSFAVIPFLTE
jgi:hypothetical protein